MANSMYLIVDGEVKIRLPHKHVHLGAGDFFGEVAELRQSRRSATVVALQTTRLHLGCGPNAIVRELEAAAGDLVAG